MTDFIEKDKNEQSIYSLVLIEITEKGIAIRQLCLTIHYLQYRRHVEEYIRELLLQYAIDPEAEDFEDLIEDIMSDLVPDDGAMEGTVHLFPVIYDWAKTREYTFRYRAANDTRLFLARADGTDVLTFHSEEVNEDEEGN